MSSPKKPENAAGKPMPIVYFKVPMTDLERKATKFDRMFHKQVVRFYKNSDSLSNDLLFKIKEDAALLRLSIFGGLPEASALVETASSEARRSYKARVVMMHNSLTVQPPATTSENPKATKATRKLIRNYKDLSVLYCNGLKRCFPMYAAHHMEIKFVPKDEKRENIIVPVVWVVSRGGNNFV